nr:hypothetical protein [Tanacetum cinerariifolium]
MHEPLGVRFPSCQNLVVSSIDHYQDLLSYLPCAQYGQERAHLNDSKFPQFVPHGAPDALHENFLRSQIHEELSDGDNIGDGAKIVGGAIGACGGIGKKASEAKRSLVKSFEGSREVFLSEAGK